MKEYISELVPTKIFERLRNLVSYPTMPKELAVAAVTVLSLFLIGGGGGRGAMLRAAVLILTFFSIIRLVVISPISLTTVALTVRIAERKDT